MEQNAVERLFDQLLHVEDAELARGLVEDGSFSEKPALNLFFLKLTWTDDDGQVVAQVFQQSRAEAQVGESFLDVRLDELGRPVLP